MTTPRYRTLRDAVLDNSVLFYAGVEVTYRGWPKRDVLAPLNSSAQRVSDYYQRLGAHPGFPHAPVDRDTGQFYLPGFFAGGPKGASLPPRVPEERAHPDLPRYRVGGWGPVMFAGREVLPGEIVAFAAWPMPMMQAHPCNESAERVLAYVDRYGLGHVNLPPSPWNEFDDSLWLPELSEPIRGVSGGAITNPDAAAFTAEAAHARMHVPSLKFVRSPVAPKPPKEPESAVVKNALRRLAGLA